MTLMDRKVSVKHAMQVREKESASSGVKRALAGLGLVVAVVLLFATVFSVARAYAVLGGEPWALEDERDSASQRSSYVARLWAEARDDILQEEESSRVADDAIEVSAAILEGMGFLTSGDQTAASQVPSWFAEEVGDLALWGSWVSNRDWSLVGLFPSREEPRFHDRLLETFQAKGWVAPSNQEGGTTTLTLTKEKGICRWMMVSFAEASDETSVVLRIQHG